MPEAVFVQAGGKSDWIWKVQPEKRFGSGRRLKISEHVQRDIEMRSAAKQLNGETMRGLRLQRKEKRPDKSLVEVLHVNRRFNGLTLQRAACHLPMQN